MSPSRTTVPSSRPTTTTSLNSSALVPCAKVPISTSPASVRSSPPDRLKDDWRTTFATPLTVSAYRRSASSLNSMLISRSRTPCRETTETPGSARSAVRTASASRRRRSSLKPDAETDSVSTCLATVDNRTSGCSAINGGKFSIRSTEVRTAFNVSTGSAKVFISTVTLPTPSPATESTRSMPTMPETLSSTRRLMSSATSAGEAPG